MGVPEAWGLTPAASNEDLGTGLPGQTSRRLEGQVGESFLLLKFMQASQDQGRNTAEIG